MNKQEYEKTEAYKVMKDFDLFNDLNNRIIRLKKKNPQKQDIDSLRKEREVVRKRLYKLYKDGNATVPLHLIKGWEEEPDDN